MLADLSAKSLQCVCGCAGSSKWDKYQTLIGWLNNVDGPRYVNLSRYDK